MRLPLSLVKIHKRRFFLFSTSSAAENVSSKPPPKSEWWYITRGAAGASVFLLPLLALNFLYEDVAIRQDVEDWDESQPTPLLPLLRGKLGMKIPVGNSIYNESATPLTDDAAEGPEDAYTISKETDFEPSSNALRSLAYSFTTSMISNPWKASYQTARGGLETAVSIKSQSDALSLRVRSLRDTLKVTLSSASCTQLDRERALLELQSAESELLRFQPQQLSANYASLASVFVPSRLEKQLHEDAVSMILLPTPNDKVIPPPPPSPTIQTSIDNARDWLVSFLPTSLTTASPEKDGLVAVTSPAEKDGLVVATSPTAVDAPRP